MLILLWGVATERPLAAVGAELERLGVPTRLIDQRDVLETEIDLDVDGSITGEVRIGGEALDLVAVTACYLRPYDCRQLPAITEVEPDSLQWRHAQAASECLSCWLEITPALVVNRLSAMASNGSKPFQLGLTRQHGFQIPETLVTTDPSEALAFWERHGTVIYKSVSSIRSRVSRLTPGHRERLSDVSSCPTQFQEHIAGTDYRAHVVGDDVFASEIRSEADDYRYPGEASVEIKAQALPQDVAERCLRLASALQLPVAGIDLRRTPQGAWYCFEVNPSPAFTYYQQRTAQPIASAIASLLAAGGRASHPVTEAMIDERHS